jgi:hypothetical protein
MNKEAFKIAVPEAVLIDLRERLSRVRYPIDFANENWAYGTNRTYLVPRRDGGLLARPV